MPLHTLQKQVSLIWSNMFKIKGNEASVSFLLVFCFQVLISTSSSNSYTHIFCRKSAGKCKFFMFVFVFLWLALIRHIAWCELCLLMIEKFIHSFIQLFRINSTKHYKLQSFPDAMTNRHGIFTWIPKGSADKSPLTKYKTYLVWYPLKLALAGPLFDPPGIKILISTWRSCKRYSRKNILVA